MSAQGIGDFFEDPLPAAVEVEDPGAGSPSWATGKMSDEVSPATTGSDITTIGVRGFLRAVVGDGGAVLTSSELGGVHFSIHPPIYFSFILPFFFSLSLSPCAVFEK